MNAPPLVLLHGWGFSSRIWQPLIKALHAHGVEQVFAIDLPGFGSAFHEPVMTLDEWLDGLAEQLPARCVLGGWSLGGMLALQLAARRPARVAGVPRPFSLIASRSSSSSTSLPADSMAPSSVASVNRAGGLVWFCLTSISVVWTCSPGCTGASTGVSSAGASLP